MPSLIPTQLISDSEFTVSLCADVTQELRAPTRLTSCGLFLSFNLLPHHACVSMAAAVTHSPVNKTAI